jgi:hypothetical protein
MYPTKKKLPPFLLLLLLLLDSPSPPPPPPPPSSISESHNPNTEKAKASNNRYRAAMRQEHARERNGRERERGADRASAKVRYASNERPRLRERSENGRTGEMHMGRKEASKPARDPDDRTLQPIHTCHLCKHAGKASEAGNLPAWR